MKALTTAFFLLAGPLLAETRGYVDVASCSSILGWAWDSTQPNTPINVDIYDSTTFIETVTANLFRSDLLAAGIGNGYHGFSYTVPAYLKDGRTHFVYAYTSGTHIALGYSNPNAYSFSCPPGSTGYQYYYTDPLTSVTSSWGQNGSVSATTTGLTATSSSGGSLISTSAVPDGSSDYEVRTDLKLAVSGGTYVMYLRATSNARTGPGATGTFYSFEFTPTFSGSACTATLVMNKVISGVVTTLYSWQFACHDGVALRAAVRGTVFTFSIDDHLWIAVGNDAIASGKPGVGAFSTPTGNTVSAVSLGPADRISPQTPDTNTFDTSITPTRVDVRFPGTPDDANGTGVALYQWYRDGSWIVNSSRPELGDETVTAGTTHTYTVYAQDYHLNSSAAASFTITTPPTGSVDPRRVGTRPTGAYWGAAPENIDLLSGNLNVSIPLLKAQGRGGWSAGFSLSYNSQNWRLDSTRTWNLGSDVGYGYGWRLMAGALTPYWTGGWVPDHYIFADASGTEYRLDQNAGGVWTSRESIYVSYDSNANRLYFPDGSFWVMGCTSSGTENDAGTMYPTTLEDTNGNQVVVRYYGAVNFAGTNSSARIQEIEDVRATQATDGYIRYRTYSFTYDNTLHLASIQNWIGTAEGYTTSFAATQALTSPFSSQTFPGGLNALASITISGIGLQYSFTCNGSGEMTQATLPYGGYLKWAYTNATYSSGFTQREVQTRTLSKDGTAGSEKSYPFSHESNTSSLPVHQYTILDDPGGVGEKYWAFNTSGTYIGLVSQAQGRDRSSGTVTKTQGDFTWTQDTAGNAYISSLLTTIDPGQPYQVQKKATQTLNTHGNLTELDIYDFSNLSSPARQYSYTYVTDTNYTSRYIYNRLVSAVVSKPSGDHQTLVTNYYDTQAVCSGYSNALTNVTGQREHDDANYGTGFTYRGNPVVSARLDGTLCANYDILGNIPQQQDTAGRNTTITMSSSSNYAAPGAITMGTWSDTATWTSFLGLASDTKQNGDASVTQFDSYARPTQTTSPYGAVTTYTYTTSPPTVTAATNGRWTKTTLDGLGRPIKVQAGDGGGVKSTVDTVYDSLACSPLGKMKQQSMPYAPNGTVVWTTYTYDGLGRTLSVKAPDGTSTGTFSYQGNTVTSTDPAGNWKILAMDAMGSITQVTEPNPAGGANLTTSYSYNMLNQLTQVSMTRNGYTQNRTFTYNGAFLTQMVNPENGTINYTYNANGTLAYAIDAKNQKTTFGYDTQGRVTQVQRYPISTGQPDPNQTVTFTYESTAGWTAANPKGRVVSVSYSTGAGARSFTEYYSYTPAGLVIAKRLQVGSPSQLNGSWTYDNEGRLTSVKYPDTQSGTGPTYNYAFDTMGRPNQLTDGLGNTLVNGITYGPSSELLTANYLGYNETRQYNRLLQMTRLTTAGSGGIDFQYNFSATQNNGKITSQQDMISGEQVSYTYDALLRLTSAVTADNPSVLQWGQSYTYDGFGSLTGVTVIKGTAPSMQIVTDPATNRVQGISYDANGNDLSQGSYDVANRMVQAGSALYGYAPSGKRVWKAPDGVAADEEFYFWSPQGQRLGTYKSTSPGTAAFTTASTNVYFGGRLIQAQGNAILTDRLGSNVTGGRRYYPYGQEKNATTNNLEKFTGYFRDAETGLDYADQRYHQPGYGRFTTPDPAGSGLNWYAYAGGDPVNNADPSGLCSQFEQDCFSTTVYAIGDDTVFYDFISFLLYLTSGNPPGPPVPPSPPPPVSPDTSPPSDACSAAGASYYNPGVVALLCGSPASGGGGGRRGGQALPASAAIGTCPPPVFGQPDPCNNPYVGQPVNLSFPYVADSGASQSSGTLSTVVGIFTQFLSNSTTALSAQGTVGVPLIPAIPITIPLSMIGVGGSASYVPSTGTAYLGPAFSVGPPGSSIGANATLYSVPSGVNVGNILGGTSASITIQPLPIFGYTVTASPGTPAIGGYTVGTKTPGVFTMSWGSCWFGPC